MTRTVTRTIGWDLAPQLERFVEEILADPRAADMGFDPARWSEDREPLLSIPGARRPDVELIRVHARELAHLLREAVSVRIRADPGCGPNGGERPGDPACVRAGCADELSLARLDGLRVGARLAELLAALCGPDPRRWPDPVRLARTSLELDDGGRGRLCLGRALLVAGRPLAASGVLALALRRTWAESALRPAVLRELSRAQHAAGEHARAHGIEAWLRDGESA